MIICVGTSKILPFPADFCIDREHTRTGLSCPGYRPWSGGHAHARTLDSTKVTKYFDYFATPGALFDHT